MTTEEFDELVERLEADAKARPQAYKLKVFLLALLGYGYIVLVFVALFLAVALVILLASAIRSIAIAGKLVIPLIVLMFYTARSLWVKFPTPEGTALTRAQAQPLFDLARELRRKLDSPRMHAILLTEDFNAGVVQVPRLGLLGWHKNYLLVGMPLLQALSLEQFRGVLAHEFGHLSGKHGHFTAWVYRIRLTWAQLMDTLETGQHWGAAVFSRFLKWYVPFFNAYTFVLARAQEYEADRDAAGVVGSRQFAEALTAISVMGAFLDSSFWPELYRKANNQPEPPSSPFPEMARAFRSDIEPKQESALLAQAIEMRTSSHDTHPSLSDRLAAIGETPQTPAPTMDTAAQSLLGGNENELCASLAEQWRNNISVPWRDRHRYAQEALQQLGLLEDKAQKQLLTLDEEWDRARFTEEFRDPVSSLPLYERVLTLDEKHAGASFAVGRLTLEESDSRAIALMANAMNINHEYVIPGCELIHSYLASKGRKEEAEKYLNWALNQSASYQAASEERSTMSSNDLYIAHTLNEQQLKQVCEQLNSYPQIKAAYLACKKVKHFPETPLYLVGIDPQSSWYKSTSDKEGAQMSAYLARELSLPGDFYVVVLTKKNIVFKKVFDQTAHSKIYQRDV